MQELLEQRWWLLTPSQCCMKIRPKMPLTINQALWQWQGRAGYGSRDCDIEVKHRHNFVISTNIAHGLDLTFFH